MGNINPRFNTDFEVAPKGSWLWEVKETGIDPQKEGKRSGKRYWARLAIVGGEHEGVTHIESFYEITKDDFSYTRLFGFLVKLGIIPPETKTLNTDMFRSAAFEDRWLRTLKGLRMGGKIGWRYQDGDKDRENPQSEMKTYYSVNEIMELKRRQEGDKGSEPVTPKQVENLFAAPPTTAEPAPVAIPKEKAPWD